ncbi:unnamed protein product [Fusarium langsethiae]|nr:unnamed protein product [Fusarium langsethiae]
MQKDFLLIKQLLDACSYLHREDYIHLDIKPPNVLMQSQSPVFVKLGDIEGARLFTQVKTVKQFTYLYAAPEVLRGETLDMRADIWSIGVMALELMVLNRLPKQGEVSRWLMDIRGCQQTLHNPTTRSFISSLLETKPQKRLTADDALSHTFWQLQESD